MDIFLNDFLALLQGLTHERRNVRWTHFHTVNTIFIPLDGEDHNHRKEVSPLKNIDSGDCTWLTCQVLFGWIIDSVNITISLPPHSADRLKEIMKKKPLTQKRVRGETWHHFLGDLQLMVITLSRQEGNSDQKNP